MAKAKPVEWNGVLYPSIYAASQALGIHVETMKARVRKGFKSDSDLKRTTQGKPIEIDGVHYQTMGAAAKALGIHPAALTNRIKLGSKPRQKKDK